MQGTEYPGSSCPVIFLNFVFSRQILSSMTSYIILTIMVTSGRYHGFKGVMTWAKVTSLVCGF